MTLPTPQLQAALLAARSRIHIETGEGSYLKLSKTGEWTYGPDDIDVEPDSKWAVNPESFMTGYICWESDPQKPAAKLGEEMRRITEPAINVSDLPDLGSPWSEQISMSLLCVSGEDKGTMVTYNTTSKGGKRAINDVLGVVINRLQTGETDEIIPVVTMHTSSYMHKRYGKVFTPIFALSEWQRMSGSPDQVTDDEAPPPGNGEDTKSEPESEPAQSPRRRIRRRA